MTGLAGWRVVRGRESIEPKAHKVLRISALGSERHPSVIADPIGPETFVKKRLHNEVVCCYSGGRSRDRR